MDSPAGKMVTDTFALGFQPVILLSVKFVSHQFVRLEYYVPNTGREGGRNYFSNAMKIVFKKKSHCFSEEMLTLVNR